mmetsp:Transcript_33038/g.105981  ORF Transcript_33038/g.105981 Transcript_33038/m.105981 type:complete len:563 (+) Transcript_33038:535-2223(+)
MAAGGLVSLLLLLLWSGAILVPLLLLLLPLAAAAYCGAWVYMGRAPRLCAAPVLKEREQARAAAHKKRVTAELERAVRLVQGAEHGEAHADFAAHVRSATSLAVYGCGILAASHVGALLALERYGLKYDQLTTLAGVSAGAVIVACLSVGFEAEDIYDLVSKMPFHRLAYPELGALLRALGNTVLTLLQVIRRQGAVPWALRELSAGNGPGINSGAELERMVGEALAQSPAGSADITLAQVKAQFGKRVVILVSELDTGRERQLTPETDPDLPLRVAVRMSMGVPGLMEPFRYGRHVYCDGGMCNDFPMNALPDDGGRLGLMVRPKAWYMYNFGSLHRLKRGEPSSTTGEIIAELQEMEARLQGSGIYPVRDAVDLAMTCMQTMMDANLALQIRLATGGEEAAVGGRGAWPRSWGELKALVLERGRGEAAAPAADGEAAPLSAPGTGEVAAPAPPPRLPSFFSLAPQIVTICGGSFSPFDFGLSKLQHRQLFVSGQVSVHLAAAQHAIRELEGPEPAAAAGGDDGEELELSPKGRGSAVAPVLGREAKLKLLLYLLHLDYSQ